MSLNFGVNVQTGPRGLKGILWLLSLIGAIGSACALDLWFSPTGLGDGSSKTNATQYRPEKVRALWSAGVSADQNIRLHFLPGVYQVDSIGPITGRPSKWRLSILGEGEVPEQTVLKLVDNHKGGESEGGGNYASIVDLRRNEEYLERIVVENITLDGNWDRQTAYNHRGYLRAYKVSPLSASARTGRIRRVIVRNFGAHGTMPQRTIDVGAGVEAFPVSIYTRDEGQLPEDGDARPWVVEDCEVSGFNSLFGGYTTCLIAVIRSRDGNTPEWAVSDESRRLVWFRRNMVRGVALDGSVIGFGAAGLGTNFTSKVIFSDNVVLNAAGFNTDTGQIRNIDFTNNLFLDAFALGYLGTPFIGVPDMVGFNVSGNGVRLRGRLDPPSYRDFVWVNPPGGGVVQSNFAAVDLGKRTYPPAVGLAVNGVAGRVRFADNWFTTRSVEDFGVGEAEFEVLHRVPESTRVQDHVYRIPRGNLQNMELEGNRISGAAFDFVRLEAIGDGRLKELSEGSTSLLTIRKPRRLEGEFRPTGVVERVGLLVRNSPLQTELVGLRRRESGAVERMKIDSMERVLIGAFELVLGEASLGSGTNITVPVRVAIQPTPHGGSGTRVVPKRIVHLEILPGSVHPQRLTAVADENGVAKFSYPIQINKRGVDRYRAWTDFGQGRRGEWDEFQDVWATSTFSLGQVVEVRVEDEVADNRNRRSGMVQLVRRGDLGQPLKVRIEFGQGSEVAELGRDFEIVGDGLVGGRLSVGASSAEVSFQSGRGTNSLTVLPLAKARNGVLATVQLVAGPEYGMGDQNRGQIVIYSPPK